MAGHGVKIILAALTAIGVMAAPAAAQQPLPLKPGKIWKHRHSGIAVPATLAGTPRDGGTAYAPDDLDVSLSFTTDEIGESLTIYIFRNTNGGVPVWFAQAQWGIEHRNTYGEPTVAIAPEAFVPPGQAAASGLRAVYEPGNSRYRSTGLMLLPVGDWYVKVRASSQTRSPTELAAWMDTALAGIQWPKGIAASGPARPVIACDAPLRFEDKSNDAHEGIRTEAIGLAIMAIASDGDVIKERQAVNGPDQWCRDSRLNDNIGVYRPDAATTRYLLAYGDNGNGLWAGPSPMAAVMEEIAEKDGTKAEAHYSLTLHTATRDVLFIPQDRLPSPERAMEIFSAGRHASIIPTWGKDRKIQINGAILK